MKIAITVSQVTPGGGITKYICTLADFFSSDSANEVMIISTHSSEKNDTLEKLTKTRKVNYVDLGSFSKWTKYVSLIARLRSFTPDILMVNYNATTQYILPFLPQKTMVVHILHNDTADFYRVASINARYVHGWIAPAEGLVNRFNEYTQNRYKEKVCAIPHGVEAPCLEKFKKTDILQLTYVGVLYEHKGVRILPEVISQLYQRGLRFHFTFIGEGVLRATLEQSLTDLIDKGLVEFTGRISAQEVYQRLSKTDIFVYPTHLDAFGLVIAEAMINGAVPVVTLLSGVTDTIVDDGVNGYLIKQDDINTFVERISMLCQDGTLRKEMSKAASEKSAACFSVETMKANYLNYLKSLLNKNVR